MGCAKWGCTHFWFVVNQVCEQIIKPSPFASRCIHPHWLGSNMLCNSKPSNHSKAFARLLTRHRRRRDTCFRHIYLLMNIYVCWKRTGPKLRVARFIKEGPRAHLPPLNPEILLNAHCLRMPRGYIHLICLCANDGHADGALFVCVEA